MSGLDPRRTVQKPGVFFTPWGELWKSSTFSTSTGSAVEEELIQLPNGIVRQQNDITFADKIFGECIHPKCWVACFQCAERELEKPLVFLLLLLEMCCNCTTPLFLLIVLLKWKTLILNINSLSYIISQKRRLFIILYHKCLCCESCISAVNIKSNKTWHFDSKSTFTPIRPWPVQGLLAKSVSCSFMNCFGRGAIKVLGPFSGYNWPPPHLHYFPHSRELQCLWVDKTHWWWSEHSFTSCLILLKSFPSIDLQLLRETTVSPRYQRCWDYLLALLQTPRLPLSSSLLFMNSHFYHSLKRSISYNVIMENFRGLTGQVEYINKNTAWSYS